MAHKKIFSCLFFLFNNFFQAMVVWYAYDQCNLNSSSAGLFIRVNKWINTVSLMN